MVEIAHAQWKIAKINEKQHQTAKLSTLCRKSMSLNPFLLTGLRPEVELIHLLHMHRCYCHVWNTWPLTDSEFAWTLSCYYYIIFWKSFFRSLLGRCVVRSVTWQCHVTSRCDELVDSNISCCSCSSLNVKTAASDSTPWNKRQATWWEKKTVFDIVLDSCHDNDTITGTDTQYIDRALWYLRIFSYTRLVCMTTVTNSC